MTWRISGTAMPIRVPSAAGRTHSQGNRAGRIAGGEEQYLVAGVLEPAGQLVDDQLDPAVQQRRDGSPRWGDHSNAHGEDSIIPTRRVGSPGAWAAWPSGLGRGLQSPVRRFDSARRLQPKF